MKIASDQPGETEVTPEARHELKKGGIHFFKTTVIGGLVFLVPVVVLVMILAKAAGLMMMVPRSPNPWSGEVHIMAPEMVKCLDLPITAYMENIERFGQGTNEMFRSLHDSPTTEEGENQ